MNSPQFYQDRKELGASQPLICLFELREHLQYVVTVYDPLEGTWETLPALPHFLGCYHRIPLSFNCIAVNQKLVLMGGYNPEEQEDVNTVFIYNFSSGNWSRGADMPVFRTYGTLSVSPEGLVYVAGGMDNHGNGLRGAAVYNVEEDEWKLLPDMSQERINCESDFRDGKFFVIGDDGDDLTTEVYDPERGAWTTIPTEEDTTPPLDGGLACSVGARSFSFHMQQRRVMEYDSKEKVWRAVSSIPETLGRFTSLVGWCDRVFVSGYAEDTGVEVFYMWTPSPPPPICGSEAEAQRGERSGKWDAIDRPQQYSPDQYIDFELTVEV